MIAAEEEEEVDDAVSVVLSVCMVVNDAEEGSTIDTLLLLLLLLLVVLFSHVDSIFILFVLSPPTYVYRLPLAVSSEWVVDLFRKTGRIVVGFEEELWEFNPEKC